MQSTPSEYLAALKAEKIKWPVKTEDGYPYANGPHDYWTGFFSSRPGSKKQVRDTSAIYNAQAELLAPLVIANPSEEKVNEVLSKQKNLLQALSAYLHHDGITGT